MIFLKIINDSLLCPLCLFSQFYTKIDFLENFATEPVEQLHPYYHQYEKEKNTNRKISALTFNFKLFI